MKPAWRWRKFADGSGEPWLSFDFTNPVLDFSIDIRDGTYQAWFVDTRIGPLRKSKQAAHNDCKRHAAKQRAELVQFARAKLPVQDFPLSKDLGHARKVDKRK